MTLPVAIAVLVVIVIAGVVIYRISITPPPPVVLVDFPPEGQTGVFAYMVGGAFESNDGSYSGLEILQVTIDCSNWSHPSNAMVNSGGWTVRIDDGSKNVIASGAAAPWAAVKFDCVSPDVSYTLAPMLIRLRFDFKGWIFKFSDLETTVTVQVPTPYVYPSPAAQVTDTEGRFYRVGTHDHRTWGIEWSE